MSKKTKSKTEPNKTSDSGGSVRRPKRQALGRGLGAMLAKNQQASASDDAASLRDLPVDRIQPGRYQPRSTMDADKLKELSDSIRSQGVVQPVIVRPLDEGYELIAGERRWRAAQMAGLRDIPAVIRQVSDEMTVAMALIENIQREDLNPLEESVALKRLIDEFSMTHQQAAEAVGRSRASVSNLLRLQDLPASVQQLLETRDIDMGHARALLALPGDKQLAAARKVVQLGLSVRSTEQLVRTMLSDGNKASTSKKTNKDPNIARLEQELSELIGAAVSIQQQSKGKGELRIRYNSLDELEGVLEHIRKAD